jgi:hypothetical protein
MRYSAVFSVADVFVRRVDTWVFVSEWDPSEQIHLGKLSSLVAEFRERVPILVRVRDGNEDCHLVCMLDHMRTID